MGSWETFKTKTLTEALVLITESYGKPYLYDNRLEFSKLENGEGDTPSESQLKDWKEGKRKLYLATYTFFFSEVTTRMIENSELKSAFPDIWEET